MYNQQDLIRPEYRNDFRHNPIRPDYRSVPSPPVRPNNVPWRQPLPARPVVHPHGLPNGSLPSNSAETYNGGHVGGVSFEQDCCQKKLNTKILFMNGVSFDILAWVF